jgi:hypothetical protein
MTEAVLSQKQGAFLSLHSCHDTNAKSVFKPFRRSPLKPVRNLRHHLMVVGTAASS